MPGFSQRIAHFLSASRLSRPFRSLPRPYPGSHVGGCHGFFASTQRPASQESGSGMSDNGERTRMVSACVKPFVSEAAAEIRGNLHNRRPVLAINVLGQRRRRP